MHFCEVVARLYGRVSLPRNTSLNWFMPALVKSSVGSSTGTSDEEGTMRCPWRSKYFRKPVRISRESISDDCTDFVNSPQRSQSSLRTIQKDLRVLCALCGEFRGGEFRDRYRFWSVF